MSNYYYGYDHDVTNDTDEIDDVFNNLSLNPAPPANNLQRIAAVMVAIGSAFVGATAITTGGVVGAGYAAAAATTLYRCRQTYLSYAYHRERPIAQPVTDSPVTTTHTPKYLYSLGERRRSTELDMLVALLLQPTQGPKS